MSKEDGSSFQCVFETTVEVMKTALEGSIECEVCKRVFLKRFHFENHNCNKKFRQVPCPICKKTFEAVYRMKRHLVVHSGEKPFECEECRKRFSLKGSLSRHLRIHKKYRPFKCKLCDEAFSQANELVEHMHTHKEETPPDCEKPLSDESSCKPRIPIYEVAKTFKCGLCQKLFSRRRDLINHRRTHINENYKCDICEKSFTLKSNLNEHMHVHFGEKPYKCEECQKSFARKSALSMHRGMHEIQSSKSLVCLVCKKHFISRSHLERHHNVHINFKCLVCDKVSKKCICSPAFEGTRRGGCYSKRSRFRCQACFKIIFPRSSFLEHIKVHSGFKCLDCGEIYAECSCTKHSIEDFEKFKDDLKCRICHLQFFHKTHLNEHLLSHKCLVCSMAKEKCVCSLDDEVDKQNHQIINCTPLNESKSSENRNELTVEPDETDTEIVEQDCEDDHDIGYDSVEFVEESLKIQDVFTLCEGKTKLDEQLAEIDKNSVEKSAIISEEFVGDDNV